VLHRRQANTAQGVSQVRYVTDGGVDSL